MANLANPMEDIDRCPQCNTAKPMLVMESAFRDRERAIVWASYRCRSCNDLVAAAGFLPSYNAGYELTQQIASEAPFAMRILPEPVSVDDDLPERARSYLSQAINARHSPDGAIMLAASAVDSMLKARGYGSGSLCERINLAADNNLLTREMADWAHSVRLESNKPRHADLDDPHATLEEVDQSLEFVRALGQLLFVLPARIERGRIAAGTKDK
jgi:hypothetical protein